MQYSLIILLMSVGPVVMFTDIDNVCLFSFFIS